MGKNSCGSCEYGRWLYRGRIMPWRTKYYYCTLGERIVERHYNCGQWQCKTKQCDRLSLIQRLYDAKKDIERIAELLNVEL